MKKLLLQKSYMFCHVDDNGNRSDITLLEHPDEDEAADDLLAKLLIMEHYQKGEDLSLAVALYGTEKIKKEFAAAQAKRIAE
jgi:hypothetical protein